jgi:hypothetical protein
MPNSARPSRPYKGNKFLIQSREYQDLNRKLHQIVTQVQQLQGVVFAMLQGAAATPTDEVVEAAIPQETWDAIEAETERLATEAANAAEYDVTVAAKEAVMEALAPQEAV